MLVVDGGRDTVREKKKKMEIASRTLLLQLLRFLNLKCGDTPPSLSSWCGASVSVSVPVRSSRTAMRLQCFVLAVCLRGISEEALKMSGSQHPGDKLRLSASQTLRSRLEFSPRRVRDILKSGTQAEARKKQKPRSCKSENQLVFADLEDFLKCLN